MKIYSILSSFLLIFSFGFSQNTVIFNNSGSDRFTINSSEDIRGSKSKDYFRLISIKGQKPIEQLNTRFEYYYEVQLFRDVDKLRIKVEMSNLGLLNDLEILKFPINKYLHPKKALCVIQWLDEDDNVLREFNFYDIKTDKKYTKLVDYTFVDSLRIPKRYKLKLVRVQGYYDEGNYDDLDKVVKAIDMYYDADARASLLLDEVKDIKLDNIEILDQYNETLKKLDIFLKNVNTKKLEIKLKYPVYDPNDLNTKLARLKTLNNNIQASMRKMRNYMHEAYYKRGVSYIEENDLKQAEFYLLKSNEIKDDYAPTLFELAKLYFNKNQYDSSYAFIYKVVYKSNADQNLINKTIDLGYKTFEGYSNKINELIASNQTYTAEILLDKSYGTCMEFKKVDCLGIFEEDFNTVYNARFQGLNNSIIEAIEKDDLILGEQYVDSIYKYLDIHSKYIEKPEIFNTTLKQLYAAYITKSEKLINSGKPETAYILLVSAQRLCNESNYLVCTNELASLMSNAIQSKYQILIEEAQTAYEVNDLDRAYVLIEEANKFQTDNKLYESDDVKTLYHNINHKFVDQNIDKGKVELGAEKFETAVIHFEKAKSIIDIHSYDPNHELDSLLKVSVELQSQQLIENAEAYVKGNKMIDANDYVEKANRLAEKYNLESLNNNLENIDKIIQSQECSNVNYQIDIQLLTSQKFAGQKDFLNSYQALQKAKSFGNRYAECNIDTININSKIDSLNHIAQYQNLLFHIEQLITEKSYEAAIDLYKETSKLYKDEKLARFDIGHNPLVQFISENKSLNFINFSIKYFVVLEQIDNGIILTETLFNKNYPANWAKNNQVILGTSLAIRDFVKHPDRDPKLFVSKYITEDKWYNNLKKAYLKQWKKLK